MEKKIDLMRLVYGQQETFLGSSLQNQDSDSEDEELFRLRNERHKVHFSFCLFCCIDEITTIHFNRNTHSKAVLLKSNDRFMLISIDDSDSVFISF